MQRLSNAIKPAVDLLYPPRCPICGEAIAEQNGLCTGCWGELEIPAGPCCALCQRPFDGVHQPDGTLCAPCLAAPPAYDGIAAGTVYNDTSRALILALKYGRKIALAKMMAQLIEARLPNLEGKWLIAPVPLHRKRLWVRGYNQAALIARYIARSTGQELLVDGLLRRKSTRPLGGLGRRQRAKELAGAIDVNPSRRRTLCDQNIILVDDVLTSGATCTACVTQLKKAGARKVIIACFARVLDDARNAKSTSHKRETPEV